MPEPASTGGDLAVRTQLQLARDALYSLGHYAPGVDPPPDWSKESHGGPTTFGFAQWQNGKLVTLRGR